MGVQRFEGVDGAAVLHNLPLGHPIDIDAGEGKPFVGRLYPQEFPLMQAPHDKDGDHIFALPILAKDLHGIGGIGAAHRQ